MYPIEAEVVLTTNWQEANDLVNAWLVSQNAPQLAFTCARRVQYISKSDGVLIKFTPLAVSGQTMDTDDGKDFESGNSAYSEDLIGTYLKGTLGGEVVRVIIQ